MIRAWKFVMVLMVSAWLVGCIFVVSCSRSSAVVVEPEILPSRYELVSQQQLGGYWLTEVKSTADSQRFLIVSHNGGLSVTKL